jgi:hypothetical protein
MTREEISTTGRFQSSMHRSAIRSALAAVALVGTVIGCGVVGCGGQTTPAEQRAASRSTSPISASAPTPSTSVPEVASAAPVAPPPHPGKDFADELHVLYRVVACQGEDPVPKELDAPTVDDYCKELKSTISKYQKKYVEIAGPWLHGIQPSNVPTTVVYPFSGGDLVTAITTYPDALDYTTLSLELAGDPRRLKGMSKQALWKSLKRLRIELGELFDFDDFSRSETLKNTQRGDIPGELAFFLVSLAVHGYEPVSLKYFQITPDGDIHYLDEQEIAAAEADIATNRKGSWTPPDFSESFANVEVTFRKAGDPNAPLHTHRHIAVNLADDNLGGTPGVVKFLEKKGQVAAVVKAASYLLWTDAFSTMRGYLVKHAVFTVSDSTGVPPSFATAGGLVQDTYGSFAGSLLPAANDYNTAFKALWKAQPKRTLPFRFGYRDRASKNHLLVTRTPDMSMPAPDATKPATATK